MYKEFENAEYEAASAAAETRRCDRIACTNTVLAFLTVLLAFTVGLIIGVLLAGILFFVLPALIALAVVFAVLIAIILILRFCMRERRCGCRRCC